MNKDYLSKIFGDFSDIYEKSACEKAKENTEVTEECGNKSADEEECLSNIKEAKAKIKEAEEALINDKAKAAKILEDSNKEVEKILYEANKNVTDAKEKYYTAVSEYNDKVGKPYVVTYTGEEAAKKAKEIREEISKEISNMFSHRFWKMW